tara:strand:- start:565 stop:1377 length:813 start_codon:yes stop_codon:yes gene_type:complete
MKKICDLLELCPTDKTKFPPTLLYNEGWMLRLLLDWLTTNRAVDYFNFPSNVNWYSEAALASPFHPRRQRDKCAESYTHADGAIGQFVIGRKGASYLKLKRDATHFVVTEAKMFSKFTSGVTHAPNYNQAARNVACISYILMKALSKTERKLEDMDSVGFYLIAPKSQIEKGIFKKYMKHDSVRETVEERLSGYERCDVEQKQPKDNESKEEWFKDWFLPTLEKIKMETLSWEQIIESVNRKDGKNGKEFSEFYSLCLKYNKPLAKNKNY